MMNTNVMSVGFVIAITFGVYSIPRAYGEDQDLLVLGDRGQVYTAAISESEKQIVSVDVPRLREVIVDTYYEPTLRKLYVTTDHGKLYEFDLSEMSKGFQRIQTADDLTSSVWYDRQEKQPAWLHLGNNTSEKGILVRGEDNPIQASRRDDIEFSRGQVFGMHIDGWKTSSSLRAKHPQLEFLSQDYPDAQWLLGGRSQEVSVYGRKIADLTNVGEPFKSTCLFHDRVRNRWHVHAFEEYCRSKVLGDVVVLQGNYLIKGDRDPVTGNLVQAEPSGNWYFYVARDNAVISVKLDPSLTVQYATAKEAIISGAGKLMKLNLEDKGQSEPNVLVELPSELAVFAVYPLSTEELKGSGVGLDAVWERDD